MIMIHVAEAGQGRYTATVNGKVLCTSKTPFLTGAREMLKRGYHPDHYIGMTRDGQRIDMTGVLGQVAKLTVTENEKTGPRFGKWQENTRFG